MSHLSPQRPQQLLQLFTSELQVALGLLTSRTPVPGLLTAFQTSFPLQSGLALLPDSELALLGTPFISSQVDLGTGQVVVLDLVELVDVAEFVGEDVVQFGVLQDVVVFLFEPAFPLPGLLPLPPSSFVVVISCLFPPPPPVVLFPPSCFTSAHQWQFHGSVFVVFGMDICECGGRGVAVARGGAFGGVAEGGELSHVVFEVLVVAFKFPEFSVEGVLLGFGGKVGGLDEELVIDV